ncbi:unnamed protein product [Meganyctiphanes norvegica]|uniref:VWFA domain-containing protein n=1 Tax=Meganyctiphanes norvegica TaxID=48144 RepID=A0AAV2Q3J7_MEGNR
MDKFWRKLEKVVSRSKPEDPPEELRKKLPTLPPGTDWEDLGIDPADMDYDDLRRMVRMQQRAGPGDSFFDFFMMNRHRNRHPFGDPTTTKQKPAQKMMDPTQIQKAWRLPTLVAPDEFQDEPVPMETEEETEVTLIQSDSVLYRVKEKTADGSLKIHSLLKMMSAIPDSMLAKGNTQTKHRASSTFNLFMGDVSGSMSSFWPSVVTGWNAHIRPNLVGRTSIMTFGSRVTTKRSGSTSDCYEITERDFDGTCTDLTGALQTIVEEVYKCKEKFINVFFITDGGHNETRCQPDEAIEKMKAPAGKICDVFVLGAGNGFPVQYSVNIRSRLHNGRANLPTIFWAKEEYNDDMEQQMKDIAGYLGQTGGSNTINLSVPGNILPFNSSQNSFHLNEYVYFDKAPEELQEISVEVGKRKGKMQLDTKNADVDLYLNEVFRQWNGMLIQIHTKKETIPPEIVPFMERLFNTVMDEMKDKSATSIKSRLASKETKGYEVNFQTLMNTIKNILTNESFSNDLELARNILSTTVTANKYAEKTLRMKGHTGEEFDVDMKEFKDVLNREKSNLMKIVVPAEDCCRVTITSTVSDLKDDDINDLLELNKYDFLKTFTISGIPIFSPLRDSAMINPWIYSIRRILKSPYTIVSQVVLENMTTANPNSVDVQSKGVKLQANDEETCFNAIIPVFPPNVAPLMKNFMRTKIYAMCCTFAILKNPHIIDYNVHMAALGIAWVRILFENPVQPRPEYVRYRIKCIEATAAQYSERPSFAKYRDLLKENTNQAIMTESTVEIDGSTLKCESLVKPMFILHMAVQAKQITENVTIKNIVKTILVEYIGRCLSNNLKRDNDSVNKTTYSDYFTESFTDQENISQDVKKYIDEIKAKLAVNEDNLLKVFYFEEQCRKAAEKATKEVVDLHYVELSSDIPIKINTRKVNQLRNVSACGDVSWASLKTFAKEVGLSESDVAEIFSDENIFLYVAHSFRYTSSRERLETPLPDYIKCVEEITKKVKEESSKDIIKSLSEKLLKEMVNSWLNAYTEAHAGLVEPMTKSQIIQEARAKEIDVNEENFEQVYKRYRPSVGLMGNACQQRSCPWFLQPMKTYNEHSSTERRNANFPHGLHITSKRHCTADIRTISNKIVEGEGRKSDKPTTLERLAELDLLHLKNSYMQMAI